MIGRIKGRFLQLSTDDTGKTSISFEAEDRSVARAIAGEIKALPEKNRRLCIQIDSYKKNRSLEQNALMWKLLEIIAEHLHCKSWTVYMEMLERYGKYTFIGIRKEAAEEFKQQFRTVKEIGTCKLNDTEGIQLQCFYGSSTYNTKEMSKLIDGIFSELSDMGIDTAEVLSFQEEWRELCKK